MSESNYSKMKKFFIYSSLFSILLIAGISCKKFLTTEVLGDYPDTQFYKTEQQALLAINAAYQPLNFTSASQNRLWVFGDVASDDAQKGGDPGDQADIDLIDQFNITPINGNLGNEWSTLYEGITRCNIVLARVPAINMDKTKQAGILAEARFLRSWYYFTLVNIFGDVPVILEPKSAEQLQIPQSAASAIFETVIEPDLLVAMANLPASYTTDIGRATSGAATALLAKAYLYQNKWDSAAATANIVITSGHYALMQLYSQDFSADFKNNVESVFEVQHLSKQDPSTGNSLNQWFAPRIDGGYGFDAPTQSFVDEFEKTPGGIYDPRLDYTIGRDSMRWFNGETFSSSWSPTGYLTRKQQQPFSEIPINLKGDADINYTDIRYADVLLWYAEALNEMGQGAQAIAPINQVRKRARESYLYDDSLTNFQLDTTTHLGTIPPGLLPDLVYTDQTTVRAQIQHERRVEFGFEFHRFFDIIRWGEAYATQAMSGSPNFNYSNNKHFPIPQGERDTNKALH
jgi:starch-binding outer membrane protein, SusD/RagB family